MNEFTKEELVIIRYALSHAELERSSIMDKTQSLIDNYCEHDPQGYYHVCVDKCKKCGAIVNE